jgi:hypothetical protein
MIKKIKRFLLKLLNDNEQEKLLNKLQHENKELSNVIETKNTIINKQSEQIDSLENENKKSNDIIIAKNKYIEEQDYENYDLREENLELANKNETTFKIILKALDLNISADEKYKLLKPLDEQGWSLYYACSKILNIDVCKEFPEEDTLGTFDCANGYDVIKYCEMAAFGNIEYEIHGSYELINNYNIDYSSKEYKDYLQKLYSSAVDQIINDKVPKHIKEEIENINTSENSNNTTSENTKEDEWELEQ